MLSRRTFLSTSSLAATLAISSRACSPLPDDVPTTGLTVDRLRPFDDLMLQILQEHDVPGAALAVAKDGELLLDRGYGWSDRESRQAMQPDSIFRIASVSKPITAMAILKLIEQAKLTLDEPVLPRLLTLFPKMPMVADRRWETVTVRHCLQHRGGWDRDQSFDPIGRSRLIAKTLGTALPVHPRQIVEYMFSISLDFEPGTRAAYSNFGYIILGCLIEQATSLHYAEYVHREILKPRGCLRTQLGRARREDRLDGEVTYYDREQRRRPSLYPADAGKDVDLPYGAENFEAYEAHGGWTSTAADLIRFAALLLPSHDRSPILSPSSIALVKERPDGAAGYKAPGEPKDAFNGLGWMVRPVKGQALGGNTVELPEAYGPRANIWHAGYIAGTEALLVHRHDHYQWCVLFNTQSSPSGKSLIQIIDPLLHQAAAKV
jgi:CubicO group peptidase (beta-lactamase class C family)